MYYHHRELQYVEYGKIYPPPIESLDPDFALAYRWLGQYCGFFPQVWLSRSSSSITGYFSSGPRKKFRQDGLLFGFESIRGFPLAFDLWCELLNVLINLKSIEQANKAVQAHFEERAHDPDLREEPISLAWRKTGDLQHVLSKHLFVKHDQVVVPNLNLKAAKLVICRNEYQKKALRQMGFIEDRLIIRGSKSRW